MSSISSTRKGSAGSARQQYNTCVFVCGSHKTGRLYPSPVTSELPVSPVLASVWYLEWGSYSAHGARQFTRRIAHIHAFVKTFRGGEEDSFLYSCRNSTDYVHLNCALVSRAEPRLAEKNHRPHISTRGVRVTAAISPTAKRSLPEPAPRGGRSAGEPTPCLCG